MSRARRGAVYAALSVAAVLAAPGGAAANHPQPALDGQKIPYRGVGEYGPTEAGGKRPQIPADASAPEPGVGPNPSGDYVAYDMNVWETLALPSRHPGDTNANDPIGKADSRHGWCPPTLDESSPLFGSPFGECANHQLEYLDHFERTMKEILGDFGVVVHRYKFHSPGRSDLGTGRGQYLDSAGGDAYNISATVPGADHPDETVLVSGHFDFTDSGPAAGWDSAEGHTEVIRIAKIMADYWRSTGTRPAATVKFIPWDSEESGTFGSLDYVQNNIPPGGEDKVRGYFNMDPCAGAYPAFRNGVPGSRVPEVMQLADPDPWENLDGTDTPTSARIKAFNTRAETIVDEVFDRVDDRLFSAPGQPEIFVSDAEASLLNPSQRGEIVTAVGGLAAFSSDYANFEAAGIPIFNIFPDIFGPHADGTPASAEGVGILHSPRDNLTTINALTSADQTGLSASEGWAKGMEMCAQLEGTYMLQPEMGGSQTATGDVVAYYEALPNEAIVGQAVEFDASGSYQYSQIATRSRTAEKDLQFNWDFGDGSKARGKVVEHPYKAVGTYQSRLTVRNPGTGSSDTMTIPVVVVPSDISGPRLDPLQSTDADGDFELSWTYDGAGQEGFKGYAVDEAKDVSVQLDDVASSLDGWTVTPASDPKVKPWQLSDSDTAKLRDDQHRGDSGTSFWTGVSPADFNPSPLNQASILERNAPFTLPPTGTPELSYWSLFQSEGDDQGRVEVAIEDGNEATPLEWEAVDVVQAESTALGEEDHRVCDPSNPETLERAFDNRRVDLTRFRGRTLRLRFVYRLGPDNRALSQPCGWYVDDIRGTSGTWNELGTTGGATTTFDVTKRKPGIYSYRVRGLFTDGVSTKPSNAETVQVTGR